MPLGHRGIEAFLVARPDRRVLVQLEAGLGEGVRVVQAGEVNDAVLVD